MKLKKKYVILFLILIISFIVILFLVFKSKNVQISNIFNRNDKLASYTFQSTAACDNWINLDEVASEDLIFNDTNYVIIDSEKTNISYKGFVYIKKSDGCANSAEDMYKEFGNKESSCSAMETFVKTVSSEGLNKYNYNYWVERYNNICKDIKELEEIAIIEYDTEKDGTDNIGDFYYYQNNPANAKCYLNYSKEITGNTCNYVYDGTTKTNHFLVDGCTWDLASYIDKCQIIEENKCGDADFKNFLIAGMQNNNALVNQIDTYNKKCDDDINYGTIIVYQNNDAYGLKCENGWEYNENGSCKRSATSGTITGPNVDSLTKYGTRKFIGWSTTKDCSGTKITNTFNIDFTGTKTYYACYEETLSEYALFESDNTKTEYDIKYVNETTTCDESSEKITNTYYRKTTNIEPYKSLLVGTDDNNVTNDKNPYCNVVCEDEVNVSYPNIFETVPAGQYFELMYEPEITATRTCTSEFNYDKWLEDYEDAITEEKEALDDLEYEKGYEEATENMVPTGTTCCGSCNCDDEGNCSCCSTPEKGSGSSTYFKTTRENESPVTASYGCRSKSSVKRSADLKLAIAQIDYKAAVEKRIKLEQNNLQCYTILDQDNNNKKYEDVFRENYSYVIDSSGDKLEINTTEYELKTPKKSISTLNNSTSNNYANYIINEDNADIPNSSLKATGNNSIGSTVDFYAVYPLLRFKYDDGKDGYPNSLNEILDMSEVDSQILSPEAQVKLDTGAFTGNTYGYKDSSDTDGNDDGISDLADEFYVEGQKDYHINFTAYYANNRDTSITRQVQYYFTYREPAEYFSKRQSGETALTKLEDTYISLTRKEKLTTKDNQIITSKNNVYPVSLKAIEAKYYNGILLQNFQNKTTSNTESNTYFDESNFGDDFKGVYSCDYKVTNDALSLSGNKASYKDLKSNTLFRSVATQNLDPNNRSETGNFGNNWLNSKGEAVKNLIRAKENDGTTTNNTYNPENLEYSFTLTPILIKYIKAYNSDTNYDDFNLTCATEDGRECISEFLTNLSQGKVGTKVYSNYSSVNTWGITQLEEIRKKWKYFIGTYDEDGKKVVGTIEIKNAIYNNSTHKITTPAISLDEYLSKYEKWGVLP